MNDRTIEPEAEGPRIRAVDFAVQGRTASASLRLAGTPGLQPLVVVVGRRTNGLGEWDDWLAILRQRGAAVLALDPAPPGRDGDWQSQTLEARAAATRAALAAGREQPEIDPARVGLMGLSQDGWVAALAAVEAGDAERRVSALVTVSGSGVTVAEQERYRIDRQLPAEGFSVMETQLARSLLDRRIARLSGGHPPKAVFADERAYSSDRWFRTLAVRDAEELAFLARIYAFDPAPVLARVPCPVLGVFGAEDDRVPVFESVKRYLASLKGGESESQVIIVPGADHDLRVHRGGASRRPTAVLETIADWLGLVLGVERPC